MIFKGWLYSSSYPFILTKVSLFGSECNICKIIDLFEKKIFFLCRWKSYKITITKKFFREYNYNIYNIIN
jgi:hypothetical protein